MSPMRQTSPRLRRCPSVKHLAIGPRAPLRHPQQPRSVPARSRHRSTTAAHCAVGLPATRRSRQPLRRPANVGAPLRRETVAVPNIPVRASVVQYHGHHAAVRPHIHRLVADLVVPQAFQRSSIPDLLPGEGSGPEAARCLGRQKSHRERGPQTTIPLRCLGPCAAPMSSGHWCRTVRPPWRMEKRLVGPRPVTGTSQTICVYRARLTRGSLGQPAAHCLACSNSSGPKMANSPGTIQANACSV